MAGPGSWAGAGAGVILWSLEVVGIGNVSNSKRWLLPESGSNVIFTVS